MVQRLKHLPGIRETQVRSLGREDPLEKEMATHSSILAWRIPWREEPDRLQSMGSQRVRHDWTELNWTIQGLPWWLSGKGPTCQCRRYGLDPWVEKIPWRRKWQPTSVYLPGESHEERSLVDYSPCGYKGSGTRYQLNNNSTIFKDHVPNCGLNATKSITIATTTYYWTLTLFKFFNWRKIAL